MDSATYRDRRLTYRDTPGFAYGSYLPCPCCDKNFKVCVSFIDHMALEHWWNLEDSLHYLNDDAGLGIQ